jgi:hypothetical protein
MRQPWPPQFKNGLRDLFHRGTSPRVSVLEADSSHQLNISMTFPLKTIFSMVRDPLAINEISYNIQKVVAMI